MNKTFKYYWEDFPVGTIHESGDVTLTQEEIVRFARQFDPQPFHVDEAAAADSVFGGIIASGWHTCSLAMRMMCDSYLLDTASQGSPGVENIKWLKPVRPGDTLHLTMEVLETRVLESKPTLGLVRSRWRMFNQNNESVMTMEGYGMFRRRPAT
ncbi:MAG: MaoC family dehydratase [Betaproteobacteria bacterium]|nr:MaoC family dehydratase [Betaproteobacteria bacterium]